MSTCDTIQELEIQQEERIRTEMSLGYKHRKQRPGSDSCSLVPVAACACVITDVRNAGTGVMAQNEKLSKLPHLSMASAS
mmetsp:Transcript_6216/g.10683  ORF Transcript_6216/g.10683 Transcript_6216/m.10683 type:complete len:80 (+) Transcript_6216:4136-4375(+)